LEPFSLLVAETLFIIVHNAQPGCHGRLRDLEGLLGQSLKLPEVSQVHREGHNMGVDLRSSSLAFNSIAHSAFLH
jgi:hypothetical protein